MGDWGRQLAEPDEIEFDVVPNRLFGMLDYLGYADHLKKKHPQQSQFGFMDMFATTTLAYGASPKPCPVSRFVMDTILIYEPPVDHLDPQGGVHRTQRYHKVQLETFVWYCAKIIESSTICLSRAIPFLPLRGAISFGPAILGKMSAYVSGYDATDIAVGPTIIDAHLWERKQNWIGISVEPNSVEVLRNDRSLEFDDALSKNLLTPWDVPTKSGLIHTYAVNFVQEEKCGRLLEVLKDCRENSASASIGAKYYATQKFVEHIRDNKLFSASLKRGDA